MSQATTRGERMSTDTMKHLGAEFHRAADSLADTLARLDMARTARLAFLRECSKDSTARLAVIKEEIRTLPEQIAKWDAEAARLESQTAEDLLRQALETKGGDANATRDNGGARDGVSTSSYARSGISPDGLQVDAPSVGKAEGEPYRAGLPPERLRKVWAEWDVTPTDDVVTFRDGEYNFASWGNGEGPLWWPLADTKNWSKYSLRPHGATWAQVEAMADEAEKKPPPTLLDLTKLPPGTVCEATNFFPIYNSGKMMHTTDRFRTQRVASGELPVLAVVGEDLWWFPALVPARVVKEGGEQ